MGGNKISSTTISMNGSKIVKPTKKIPEANGSVQTKLQSNLSVQLRLDKKHKFTVSFYQFPAPLPDATPFVGQGAGIRHAISGCKVWGHLAGKALSRRCWELEIPIPLGPFSDNSE